MRYYVVKSQKYLIYGVIFSTINALLSVLLSFSMGIFVTAASIGDIHDVIINSVVSLLSIGFQLLFYSLEGRKKNQFIKECIENLKLDVVQKMVSTFKYKNKEEDIFLIENKIPQIGSDYFGSIFSIVSYLIQMMIASLALFFLNKLLFLLFFVISLTPIVMNTVLKKNIGQFKKRFLDEVNHSHTVTREVLESMLESKIWNVTKYTSRRMKASIAKIESLREKSNSWDYFINRIAVIVGMLAQMVCMIIAALFIVAGFIPVGGLTTATQL